MGVAGSERGFFRTADGALYLMAMREGPVYLHSEISKWCVLIGACQHMSSLSGRPEILRTL